MNWREKGGGGRARRVAIRKITPVPFLQISAIFPRCRTGGGREDPAEEEKECGAIGWSRQKKQ